LSIQQSTKITIKTSLVRGSTDLIVRRYITTKGKTILMIKDTGAKAKLNHEKLGENEGKTRCIHADKNLRIIPAVRETSKDAMNNVLAQHMLFHCFAESFKQSFSFGLEFFGKIRIII